MTDEHELQTDLDYGPVIVTNGPHAGRIGYYDDCTSLLPSELEKYDISYSDSFAWRDYDGEEEIEDGDEDKILDVAIIYFGEMFIAIGYFLVPFSHIRPVTTDDLIKRRNELHKQCGAFAKHRYGDSDDDYIDEDSLLRELHFVDALLVDRMIQARYSNNKKGKKIFISHSSEDKPFARWIGTDLNAAGHSPWLDEWEIKVGESIPNRISEGVKEADFVIVVLSDHAVKSNWVEREWQNKYWDEVRLGSIQVLPILYKDCEIPELLKTKRYADFRNSYNDGLEDILSAIDSLSQ